jgi:RNA polymerase sigma-70 factor (ECF subfamily)
MSSTPYGSAPAQAAPDLALMRRVVDGDHRSRQDLMRRLLPRAQRLCQALLRNGTDAKDASQSALLQVLRSAHTYRGECSIEHWSDRIVTRTALRWIAAERRTRQEPLADETSGEHGASQPRVLLRECLNRLQEPQRTTLLLRAGFEYSIEEIASLTDVSPNTVKDRLTRARQTLRALVRTPEGAQLGGSSESSSQRGIPAPPTRPPKR